MSAPLDPVPQVDGPPRVFVSYSHDSDAHRERVGQLVQRLRVDGIALRFDVDQTEEPTQGWPGWCEDQIEAAELVLAICTPIYRRRFEGRERPGVGRGATWEGEQLRSELEQLGGLNCRIVPVLLPGESIDAVPDRIRRTRRYSIESDYPALLALLRERQSTPMAGRSPVLPTQLDELLIDGIDVLPEAPAPSQLLNARYGAVPFLEEARHHELTVLSHWCEGDGVRVRLFHGPGGAGKTRLLQEWCSSRRKAGWNAGFLPTELGRDELELQLESPDPTLLVIDYAESKPLDVVLDAVVKHRRRGRRAPLRVALLARTAGGWWDALKSRSGALDALLSREPPVGVTSISPAGALRRVLFEQAHRSFSERRGVASPPPVVDLDDERYGRILYLHAAALEHVERTVHGSGGARMPSASELLGSVLGHEERFWLKHWPSVAGRYGEAKRNFIRAARRTISAITLRGGVPDAETARAILQATEAPRTAADGHASFTALLRLSYPGRASRGGAALDREAGFIAPLEPDLLGETLVAKVLRVEDEGFVEAALVDASAAVWEHGFTVLGRVMETSELEAETAVEALLSRELELRAVPAVKAVLTVSQRVLFGKLARIVTSQIMQRATVGVAESIEAILPEDTLSLVELGAWVLTKQLSVAEGAERARLLNNLGNRQGQAGKREQALASAVEAVAIRRELAKQRPEVYLPALAASLNNLSNCQNALGMAEQALASVAEAVASYRELARTSREVFLPDLAMSLNTLGVMRCALEKRAEALTSTAEAVAYHRELAEAQPEVYLPDLAASLHNLAIDQNRLGRREEALASISQAIVHFRELAKDRPDTFLDALAINLDNLGTMLGDMGQRKEALAASTEAVMHHRRLAEERPDAFLPSLARGLDNLSSRQSESGMRDEALASILESVAYYRALAKARPEVFLSALAGSLNNLGNRQSDLGELDDALASNTEAVAHYRELANEQPEVYLPDLAMSLTNLASARGDLGQLEGALASAAESVAHYRELVRELPDAFLPELASSLANLGVMQLELEQRGEALASALEAVAIRRELAAERPEAFLPDLAMGLTNLAGVQGALGKREEAVHSASEAVGHYRELAEQWPEMFLSYLGGGLNNLGVAQLEAGERAEALVAMTEAVVIRRRLADERPELFVPELVMSLTNLSNIQSGSGGSRDALASTTEAVARCLELFSRSPEDLAEVLEACLRVHLRRLGDLGRPPGSDPVAHAALDALGRPCG